MGDYDQCHRSTKKTARPILTLGGERCEWTGQPVANYRVRERLLREKAERLAASEDAIKRAQERRLLAQERRDVRKRIDAARAADDQRFAERRRETWIELVREATEIGLKPDPQWTEHQFRSEIWYKKLEIRREEEDRAREEYWAEDRRRAAKQLWRRQKEEATRFLVKAWKSSVARNRSLKISPSPDHVGEQWEYIPHIVKFGSFDADSNSWGFGREHRSVSRINFPARTPQKQRRTWEAQAPRKWRRKDQCAECWDHLFNDPTPE